MNLTFQASILGTIQGLTEFLPISSSAHLTLVPWLFNWLDPGLSFDVALHLGTLLALLIYYWREWRQILSSPFNGDYRNQRLLLLLIAASIPGAVMGLLLEKQAESAFRSPLLIAIALAVMGLVLWWVDRVARQNRGLNQITLRDGILLGFAQALALIPGVSRSGITITVGRALGVDRESAANFSFLMATPIIAGAGLLKARELIHAGISKGVVAGFVCAAIFGLLAIAVLIQYVRSRSYGIFAWYRLIFAALIIILYGLRAAHV